MSKARIALLPVISVGALFATAVPASAQEDDTLHIEVDLTANEGTETAVLDVTAGISGLSLSIPG